MNVLIICGSIADNSGTKYMLKILEQKLLENNIKVSFVDLATFILPMANPIYNSNPLMHPDKQVVEFVQKVDWAQGIILGTPLYHGSFSGVLKNALDLLSSNGFDKKIVGLVAKSGGERVATLGCEALRPVVRALCGYNMQTHIGLCKHDFNKTGDNLELINNSMLERCDRFIEELLYLLALFNVGRI